MNVTAAAPSPSFVPDVPLTGGAPKISLLDAAAQSAEAPADQSAFAGTLRAYMNEIGGIRADGEPQDNAKSDAVSSIGDTVKSFVSGVNTQIVDSDHQTRDLLSGKTHDTGKVTAAVEEADLSLDMMLAVTKRVTSAYQAIQSISF